MVSAIEVAVDASVGNILPDNASVSLVSLEDLMNTDNYTMKTVQQHIIQTALQKRKSKNDSVSNKKNGLQDKLEARDSNGEFFRKPSSKYDYVKSKVDSNLQKLRPKMNQKKHHGESRDEENVVEEKRVQENVTWRDAMRVPNNHLRSFSASPQIEHVKSSLIEPVQTSTLRYRSKSVSVDDLPESSVSGLMPADFHTYIKASATLNANKGTTDITRAYKSYLDTKRSKIDNGLPELVDDFRFNTEQTGQIQYQGHQQLQEIQSRYSAAFNSTSSHINNKPPVAMHPYPPPSQQNRYQPAFAQYSNTWADQTIPVLKPLRSNQFPNRPYSEQLPSTKSLIDHNNNGVFSRPRPSSDYHYTDDTSPVRHSLPDFRLNKNTVQEQSLPQVRQSYTDYFNMNNNYFKGKSNEIDAKNDNLDSFSQTHFKHPRNSFLLSQRAGMILERLQQRHTVRQEEQKQAEEKRLTEHKRVEEQYLLEQKRIAEYKLKEQKQLEEQRLQRQIEEKRKLEQKRIEEKRLQEQRRMAQRRLIEQKQADEQRQSQNNKKEKFELSLSENIRFLQELKQNSLPSLKKLPSLPSRGVKNGNNNTLQWNGTKLPIAQKTPSFKENSGLSISMPEFLNYTNKLLSNESITSKTPNIFKKKKSVRIALENNRLHLYSPDLI